MPVQVPKLEQPQRPMGENLIPTVLSSILYPARIQAAQQAMMQRQQTMEDAARQANIGATQQFGPTELEKLTGLPSSSTNPEDITPPMRPGGITNEQVEAIKNLYPANQPYGTSTQQFGNIRAELGMPGGKVKTGETFSGYGPSGEQLYNTVPLGIGAPVAKAPQLMNTTTPTGTVQVTPKVPNATVSTPEGTTAQKAAQGNMPALFSQAYHRDNPGASDMDVFKAWQDTQIATQEKRGMAYGAGRYYPVVDENGEPTWMRGADIQNLRNQGKPVTPAQYSPSVKQKLAEAGQRGGATTANIVNARTTYAGAVPAMLGLREAIAAKGLLPTGTDLKDVNHFNMWLMDHMSDPDVAALGTKAGMMQEALSRALGSGRGGEYYLKFAQSLLNPAYNPEAFTRVVQEHMKTLNTMAYGRQHFGEPGMSTPGIESPSALVPGQVPAGGAFGVGESRNLGGGITIQRIK